MDTIHQMKIFIQVAQSGGFTRAAEVLSIPRSTVSTEIRKLEMHLQTQLLFRSTRKVSLTSDGMRYLQAASDIVAAVEMSDSMFSDKKWRFSGKLRIDVPSRIGHKIIIPELPALINEQPDLSFIISSNDRYVDLIADGVDCALRVGKLADSDYFFQSLGKLPFITCASPTYLEHHGTPQTFNDLRYHLVVNYSSRLPAVTEPTLHFMVRGNVQKVTTQSLITVDGGEGYITAALAGLGIVQVPAYDVQEEIKKGTLVEVLPNYPALSEELSLLYTKSRNISPKLRFFQRWIHGILLKRNLITN